MKILIITHYFPPENSVASMRPHSWAKYWTMAGHELTVLTTKKGKTDTDLNLPNHGFEIIEIHSKASRNIKKKNNEKKNANTNVNKKSWIRRQVSWFCNRTGAILNDARYPNIFMFWKKPAIEAILKSEKHYDIAIATHAPFVTFMIASELKKRGIVDKIVFDFRDLWTNHHLYSGIPILNTYEKWLEKRLCKLADVITVVSDNLADILRTKVDNDKIFIIPNGFDMDDLSILPSSNYFDNKKINIVYTGSIYMEHTNPSLLLDSIKELKDVSFNLDKLNICFIGSISNSLDVIIKKYCIGEFVYQKNRLSREETLRIQRDADVLLFFEWTEKDGILTGKLFEYMFSGTQIWTIGRKWQPSRMIEELGLGKAFGNDVQLIKKELINLLNGNLPPKNDISNIKELQKYTREYQANKLLKIIEKL